MKKLILLIVVVFGFNLPAFANEIDDLKQKCEANDGRSCNNLGAMYVEGRGVTQDDIKAVSYFQKACDLDDGLGCHNLGFMYDRGRGVKRDNNITGIQQEIIKAGRLYQKACKLEGSSCTNLGLMYDKGKGVKQGDFYKTDFGFNIHQDCFDNFGKNKIEGAVKEGLTTGLQCLANLGDKFQEENPGSESISGALRNAVDIRQLLERGNLKLVCNEKKFNWGGHAANARASASDYGKIKDYNGKGYDVGHPFMSLYSSLMSKKSTRYIAKSIFHEIFHSVGQFHGIGIEYAYTCNECCFPNSKRSKEAIDISCKICGLDKSKGNTKPYLLDFIKWTRLNEKNRRHVTDAVMNYIKEYPEDRRWGIVQVINAQSGPFSPTAIELIKILEKKLPALTYDEKRIFAEVKENKKYKGVHGYDVQSKAVAESLYSLLYEQNRTKALSSLENQLESLKKPHSSQKTTTWETRTLLRLVLNDIRFSQNSSYAEIRRAENLMERLNL